MVVSLQNQRIWILVDASRCSGCKLCEVVCSLKHEGKIWPEASRIRIFEEIPGATVPHLCVQCPDYPCVKSCPVNALSVYEKTGAVVVDEKKCIGCGRCVDACPGKVPRIPGNRKIVVICDLCYGDPECVKICNEAGYGALRLYIGGSRPTFKTFARNPIDKSLILARKMFGE